MAYKKAYKELWLLGAMFNSVLVLTAYVSAAPGDLDPTFGNGGIVVTPNNSSLRWDSPHSIQVQSDGKILVSGTVDEETGWGDSGPVSFFLARYNPKGMLDTSFGTNGKVFGSFGLGDAIVGVDIGLQEDGKIVAIGYRWTGSLVFAVNRYNSDGTLDTSFGTGGRVVTPAGGIFQIALRVVIQPDGKIVVAGYSHLGGGDFAFVVVRYRSDGSLDSSFGGGGIVLTPIGNNYVWVGKVLLQPNGKIIIVGGSGIDGLFTLVRYNSNGSLDSEFGSNGKIIHSLGAGPASFSDGVLQPDGKILAAGRYNGQTAILRYNSNGSLDTTFAAKGIFYGGPVFSYESGLALQPDGKALLFGNAAVGGVSGFAVERLGQNGSPDASFGSNGTIATAIGTNNSFAVAGALQADGKILEVGAKYESINATVIIRYLGDAMASRPARCDFDGDGKSDISVFRPSDKVWYLNRSTAGFAASQFGATGDLLTPADFTGDEKTDVAVFRPSDGGWYVLRSEDLTFYGTNFGESGDIPAPADYDGDGNADPAVYRPSEGTWYLLRSTAGFAANRFGVSEDKPAIGDFDGDGKADISLYRPSNGVWYRLNSSNGSFTAVQFGAAGDKVVPADYTGDGKTDIAVWRPSNGTWYIMRSEDLSFFGSSFGLSSDTPAPGDYDGDGKADIAVYRPSQGIWYTMGSVSGFNAVHFGIGEDKPAPGAFVY